MDIKMNIEEHINALMVDLSVHVKAVQEYIKNTNIPLSHRWDVAKKAQRRLPNEDWLASLSKADGSKISLFDDFYMERKETKDIESFDDSFLDCERETEESGSPYNGFTKDDIVSIKEQLLATGCGTFTYDW